VLVKEESRIEKAGCMYVRKIDGRGRERQREERVQTCVSIRLKADIKLLHL